MHVISPPLENSCNGKYPLVEIIESQDSILEGRVFLDDFLVIEISPPLLSSRLGFCQMTCGSMPEICVFFFFVVGPPKAILNDAFKVPCFFVNTPII
jgi:hypothetical protein